MSNITQEGSNRILTGSVQGSIFPRTENETVFSLLIGSGSDKDPARVRGSVYGREVKILGPARIDGPLISRGDLSLKTKNGRIQLLGGITAGGNIVTAAEAVSEDRLLAEDIRTAGIIIKGDVTAAKDVYLADAIVFGSIRAVNCKLERCIVLGTICVAEKLTISSSAISGYACRAILFEGRCTMIHALGESVSRPVFAAAETIKGVQPPSVAYYPAIRQNTGFLGACEANLQVNLEPGTDWVQVRASGNQALDQQEGERMQWVLSLGGRVADFGRIRDSIEQLSVMLKCGFEFEHYHPKRQSELLAKATSGLNDEEAWILKEVCPQD